MGPLRPRPSLPTAFWLIGILMQIFVVLHIHHPLRQRGRKSFSSFMKIFIHEFSQLKHKCSLSIYGGPPSSDNSCTDRYTQTEPQTKNTLNMHHVHHMHVMMHVKLWAIISLLRSGVLINTAYGSKPCCVCACCNECLHDNMRR